MTHSFSEFSTNALLKVGDESLLAEYRQPKPMALYAFIWSDDSEAKFIVDGIPVTLPQHSILALTTVQYFQFAEGERLKVYLFNRDFYCIKDHDKEVGCAGLLFFGNIKNPVVHLNEKDRIKFNMLHEVFIDELETKDTIQAEMLRMLMARFIIKSTRLLKAKERFDTKTGDTKTDLLRAFNVLVEDHFRTEHRVQFYADALYKSPKTLSNNFAKLNTGPLKIIHERIVLEAKRLLMYTDKAAKEIAYELGFEDASHLSRLFKKHTSLSPSDFKKQHS